MQNNFVQILSPLDQFEIRNLISIDAPVLFNMNISLTNIGLYLVLAATTGLLINVLAINNDRVVSNG
jgi:F-type H+-transporting ATPase subunit a